MIKLNFSKKLFYLLLLLLPCNLAKHFILDSSFVNGVLVDYLVPTVYLTDIILILMLVAWGIERITKTKKQKNKKTKISQSAVTGIYQLLITNYGLLITFLLFSGLSIFFALNKTAAIYKFIKLLEHVAFYFYIVKNVDLKNEWTMIIKILTIGALFQAILTIAQWFKQSSTFGYWFFGEPGFNVSTPGIARMGFFGKLKVRPYGTFPHPNALGGYLAIILALMFNHLITNYQLPITKKIFNFQFSIFNYLSTFFILFTALLLTFSRSAIFVGLLGILISTVLLYYRGSRMTRLLGFFVFLCFCVFVFLCFKLDFDALSFTRRSELATIAFQMIKARPWTGIGLNNFTVVMQNYGSVSGLARFLQPVHNVYLLIAAETGILGSAAFLLFVISHFFVKLKQLVVSSQQSAFDPSSGRGLVGSEGKKNNTDYRLLITDYKASTIRKISLTVLVQILILMLFDHYFWTLQQTSLLFWLLMGLIAINKTQSRDLVDIKNKIINIKV